ncbi:hypothetical protein E5288_WYG003743 [Bos mutus]|uniref:Small ribosomal subunit protein uS14 n=1 Tax=Bos mutus TaxID=72004 RepID=A0A6B0REG7_9CETA|nr:hypothetical protein [Bos mutus]
MRTLPRSFYLVAAEKATWVTSSSTGAIRENSARVLALGEKQNVVVWKGCFGARHCLKYSVEEPTGGAWGETESESRVCSNRHGLIRKYGLNMCRQCFRQYAKDIGFIKLD